MSTTETAINTNVRLFDLVRHQRAALHEDELITDEEYAWLCGSGMAGSPQGGSPSPRRLEDYDRMREQLRIGLPYLPDEIREKPQSNAMATAQLDHLRAIDAHLDRLLRTPAPKERWGVSNGGHWIENDKRHKVALSYTERAPFIAACANNAEAGWRSTKAAIAEIFKSHEAAYEGWVLVCKGLGQESGKYEGYPLPPWAESILAEWPIETLKP